MYIAKGNTGKQQGAGQGRNKTRPLTLSAVTEEGNLHRALCKETIPVSGLILKFRSALDQQVAAVSTFVVAVCFFNLLPEFLFYLNVRFGEQHFAGATLLFENKPKN